MAATVQLEDGNGLLPPLRELFLEMQVNKLINDYLFSSNADTRCTFLHSKSSECKENQACFLQPGRLQAKDASQRSACNAPCVKSVKVLDDHHTLCLQDLHSSCRSSRSENQLHMETRESLSLHSRSGPEDESTNNGHEASFITLPVDNDSRKVQKTAHLSRADTFPCSSKVQLQASAPCKVGTEVKASCKKPPRPPASRLLKSELCHPIVARSFSDHGAYLKNFRRVKAERKRKASASASAHTSTWALLFTFCFAMIMISQGFWSQGNQIFESNGTSPVDTVAKGSMKGPAEDMSLAGAGKDGQTITDSVPAQTYKRRKILLQHISDKKLSEPDASRNP